MDHFFTEEDKAKFIQFLNMVATHAEWKGMDTQRLIEYFKLLSHMQTKMLPKLEANILEITKVVQPESKG